MIGDTDLVKRVDGVGVIEDARDTWVTRVFRGCRFYADFLSGIVTESKGRRITGFRYISFEYGKIMMIFI